MSKFVKPEELYEKFQNLAPNLAVTKGEFECVVAGLLGDMEWNHMDQLHRPFIHHTYQESLRIALGEDFAISLTRWGKWPLFIVVSDVRLKPGLFYQCMTIAGLINVHLVISMVEANEKIHSKLEWYITSHKWLKIAHKILSKKFYNLNVRLQEEDAQIRQQRYELRKAGYRFESDPPDYLSSNTKTKNTIYPEMASDAFFVTDDVTNEVVTKMADNVAFLVRKNNDASYDIWPSACPHEGGELKKGSFCESQVTCPWHGLRFQSANVSVFSPNVERYGFHYRLDGNRICVSKQKSSFVSVSKECAATA